MVPEEFPVGFLKCKAPEVTVDDAQSGAACQHVAIENAADWIKSGGNDQS